MIVIIIIIKSLIFIMNKYYKERQHKLIKLKNQYNKHLLKGTDNANKKLEKSINKYFKNVEKDIEEKIERLNAYFNKIIKIASMDNSFDRDYLLDSYIKLYHYNYYDCKEMITNKAITNEQLNNLMNKLENKTKQQMEKVFLIEFLL